MQEWLQCRAHSRLPVSQLLPVFVFVFLFVSPYASVFHKTNYRSQKVRSCERVDMRSASIILSLNENVVKKRQVAENRSSTPLIGVKGDYRSNPTSKPTVKPRSRCAAQLARKWHGPPVCGIRIARNSTRWRKTNRRSPRRPNGLAIRMNIKAKASLPRRQKQQRRKRKKINKKSRVWSGARSESNLSRYSIYRGGREEGADGEGRGGGEGKGDAK